MADTTTNKQFSVMVDNGGVLSYPQNFITANSVATKIDLANKQDKLTFVEEDASIGDLYLGVVSSPNAYITLTQDGGIMAINSPVLTITSVNPIKINSDDGFEGSGIVTSIGTSTTSSKLPTEGAVVKAISDVKTSLGSALTYEGSVENYSNLPTGLTTSDKGKVYNVVNANGDIPAGTNYAWNGTSWDALGGDMSAYLRKEGDTTLELGSSIDDETEYIMIPGKITVNGEYHGQFTEITKDQIHLESDVGTTLLNSGELHLDHRGTNMTFYINGGIGGTLVDKLIPSTPEDGHIATTGAIKTYVDNKVASGGSAPSNMVTTDTEQTITGKKSFEAETGVYKLTQYGRMIDGDSDISSIRLGYNYTEINAKNEGIFINSDNVTFGDNSNNLDAGNIGKQMLTIQPNEIIFGVPYVQRVYSPNTYKWTETLKYTYLSKDVNGNVTFTISDSLPREVNFNISSSVDSSGVTSALSGSAITLSITHAPQEGEDSFDFSQTDLAMGLQHIKLVVNRYASFSSSTNITTEYLDVTDILYSAEYIDYIILVSYESGNITIGGQQLDLSSIPASVPQVYAKFEIYRNGEKFGESSRFKITR